MGKGERQVSSLTLEEATTEREILVREAMEIQADLSQRNKTSPNGRRLSAEEYWQWHSKATYALLCKQRRMAELKAHIRQLRKEDPEFQSKDLLFEAYRLLKAINDETEDFNEQEQDLMRRINSHLYGA